MFVHSGALPHLLPPEAYYSPEWFEREKESIFLRQWTLFCLASQVRNDGDQLAAEVHGIPVVVIRQNGKLAAVKNVCAHRHSQMVPDGCQNHPRLRCQIHGWEYNSDGSLAKITDGASFHGYKATNLCLKTFRVEELGPFVFVNLSSEGPTAREHLGGFADDFERFYGNVRHIGSWSIDAPVNWKVIAENGIESYHVPMVHPNTYEDYRPQEEHDHQLAPTYSRYGDLLPYSAEKKLESYGFRFYTWLLIPNPTYKRFTHLLWYPNHNFYYGDIFSGCSEIRPLGPELSRVTFHNFVPATIYWGLPGRWLQDLSMMVFTRMGRKIVQEDVDRWPPVQRGLHHADFPGILSCREERVYALQKYVAEKLQIPIPSTASPGES